MASFGEDITEYRQNEIEFQCTSRALRAISGCSQALIRAGDEAELLNRICRIVVETGNYRMAWVGFADQDEAKSVRPVALSGFEDGYLDEANISWSESEHGRGPTGTSIRTRRPVVAWNILSDPAFAPWRTAAIRRGYASVIALPLITDDWVLGALLIYAGEPDAFGKEEVRLLQSLADSLAYGIQSLRSPILLMLHC